eukprot:scaffold362383_cov19-Prasinocladus_malaysianus.AAC.1
MATWPWLFSVVIEWVRVRVPEPIARGEPATQAKTGYPYLPPGVCLPLGETVSTSGSQCAVFASLANQIAAK